MARKPLIIGIDPGTTTAYAILDIYGEVVKVDSSKDMGLNDLIGFVTKNGLPIAVGTDKAKVPDLIERFAAKTGCKIVSPFSDLKVDEKKQQTKGYDFKNSHQMDALASAILTHKQIHSLIDRVIKSLKSHKKEDKLNEIIPLVVKEGVPIKDAFMITEEGLSKAGKESNIIKKVLKEEKFTKNDFLSLYSELRSERKDNSLLRKYVSELKNKLNMAEKELDSMIKKVSKKKSFDSKKIDTLFSFKESRIKELKVLIENKDDKIKDLVQRESRLISFFSDVNKMYLIKKLRNFSLNEFQNKLTKLKIANGDILFVDDINVANDKIIDYVNDNISAVVYKINPSKATERKFHIELISKDDLDVRELDDLAIVDRAELDKRLSRKNVLKRIVEEYKEGRRNKK